MEYLLMNPQFKDDDEDLGAIDLDSYSQEQDQMSDDDLNNSSINLDEYSNSPEAQEASWWETTKDVAIQGIRGTAQAFSWPMDVLKLGMMAEGLSDIDELEESFAKAGKPFDRDAYIKTVTGLGEYIPTQGFFEEAIQNATGINLQPTTKTGKFVNKAATVASLTKGSGLSKLLAGAAAGGTTEGLKALGVNETVADISGDVVGGGTQALKKGARVFTKEAEALRKVADKHGLPFYEFMTKPPGGIITPKVAKARELAIMKELGVNSEQAAKAVLEGRIPLAQLRSQGFNLSQLEKDAYQKVETLAAAHKKPIPTKDIVSDIKKEIATIKKTAPSPSDAEKTYMSILEDEAKALTLEPKKQAVILGPNGQPLNPQSKARIPKEISAEELIKQHKNYNSNVKGIYRKPEFSGREEAVRNAYAFLNNSVRNTLEKEGGSDLANSFKEANHIFNQRSVIKRSEALIDKAFVNGEYNPKKLSQVLNSRQGEILRRDIGDKGVNELKEIAQYGEKAISHTDQLLKSPKFAKEALTWGTLAPFILGSTGKMTGMLYVAKPIAERIKGYLLSRPATRTAYNHIIKNAAKGSFKNMQAEFSKLNELVSDEFESPDQFIKQIMDDLEVYEGEF